MNIPEAARRAGVCRETIYDWMRSGELLFTGKPYNRQVDLEAVLWVKKRHTQNPRTRFRKTPQPA